MVERNLEYFDCSVCGLKKGKKFLANVLVGTADLEKIKFDIEEKSKLWRELEVKYNSSIPGIIRTSYTTKMASLEKEIAELGKQVESNQKPVCSACLLKGREKVAVSTFTCEFCQQLKSGSGLKRHIGGWEDKGIYPQYLITICRQCQIDYALSTPQDFYCPRTSDGRDDFSQSGGKKKFDCSCSEQDNALPDRPFKDIF